VARAPRVRVAVTGAAGFIGSHVVLRLLERGHEVVGTVRDASDAGRTDHLRALAEGKPGSLRLVSADLMEPGSFDAAVSGCRWVVHTASSVRLTAPEPQRDIVDVAVRGTAHVLEAARRAETVERVVLTSSIAAVVDDSRPAPYVHTESDWNESATLGKSPYPLSKVEAERFAWRFMDELPPVNRFSLVTLQPGYTLGPVLARGHLRTSPGAVRDLLRRTFPACPKLSFSLVDVRDVAEAHVRALENEDAAGRYICVSRPLWMREMSAAIRAELPQSKAPTRELPNLVMYAVGALDKRLSFSFLRRNLGKRFDLSAERARTELGLAFRPPEESVRATARSIVDQGFV
jgi:nucleoside-diphosphate-sugar epimerase